MNHENAAKLLRDVHQVLDGMGKKHFLIDGTLLGYYREGGFIAHDTDMDIGVFFEEWTPMQIFKLTTELGNRYITLKHQLGDFDKYFEVSYRRDGIKIDLFFYRRQGPWRIFHAFLNAGRNLPEDVITYEYPAELIEEMAEVEFVGEKIMAPKNIGGVLVAKYGPDWHVPVTDWDWKYGPKNVRK